MLTRDKNEKKKKTSLYWKISTNNLVSNGDFICSHA